MWIDCAVGSINFRMVSEKAPQKGRFELDFEEGAIICLVKIEVHFKTEEGAFAKAQICKRKHLIWGTEQDPMVTLPPAVSLLCEVGGFAPLELLWKRLCVPCAAVVLIQGTPSCFCFLYPGLQFSC